MTTADRLLQLLPPGQPTRVRMLACRTGLSESYIAAKLQRLHLQGQLQRQREHSGKRGQPAWAYIRPSA